MQILKKKNKEILIDIKLVKKYNKINKRKDDENEEKLWNNPDISSNNNNSFIDFGTE